MKLEDLQKHWNEFGRRDPLWAILTIPQKRNRQWDVGEFFRTGEEEIAGVMAYIDSLGVPRPHRRALDFGCGVGRITQALCRYFDESCGVDIAESMIDLARQHNRNGDKCRYFLNASSDLRQFDDQSFDFIFTTRVLQHMRPEYSTSYMREFLRVLAPNGLAVFQIPSSPLPRDPGHTAEDSRAGLRVEDVALPEQAFQAEIRPRDQTLEAPVRSSLSVAVAVTNTSNVVWHARRVSGGDYALKLGNHWLSLAGRVVVQDDGRAVLADDVHPGQQVELQLTINTPAQAGRYLLEFDLVQEQVAWFASKGSQTARARVRLRDETPLRERISRRLRRPAAQADVPEVPIMEMYGVPQAEVARLVAEAGGRILDVRPDHIAGEGWISFVYCAMKR